MLSYQSVSICLFALVALANAQTTRVTTTASPTCNITGINSLTEPNLYDLRTPTPYTMTLTAIANDCAEDPITVTYTPTLSINQTLFSVTAPVTVTVNTQTVVFISFTFPDLIVTSLTRGEPLVFLEPAGIDVTFYVPATALTYTPSPSPYTHTVTVSATTTVAGSSTNNLPVPGIIAGAVVGGIACVALIAFGLYSGLKARNDRLATPAMSPYPLGDYYNRKHASEIGTVTNSEIAGDQIREDPYYTSSPGH